jgi:uncharacterized RDD family membrane protein YckC
MSMPQGDRPGENGPWESGQQPGTPGQPQYGSAQSGPTQYGQAPGGGAAGDQYGGPMPGGPMQGRPISPVNEIETRVTGRRTVQFIIDYVIYAIVAAVISWALDRGHGGIHALLTVVLIVIDVIWYTLWWALRPYNTGGQTVGMQVMGLRVISRDGGQASLGQLFGRSILLVLFFPLSVLVGVITMMFSRYRQRVGDHLAKTMVVSSRVEPVPSQEQYAGAGQAGAR